MDASELVRLLDVLEQNGVTVWLDGGWGVDALLGEQTREHDDVDLVVPRDDQGAVRRHFAGWDLHLAHDGKLTPWNGERLELPVHTIWARRDADAPWELEILLMEAARGRWLFRRDPGITLPLERVGLERDGIPYLAPEVPLLYKAKEPRERDAADFAAVVDELPLERRRWLARALHGQDPGHPWLVRLTK